MINYIQLIKFIVYNTLQSHSVLNYVVSTVSVFPKSSYIITGNSATGDVF